MDLTTKEVDFHRRENSLFSLRFPQKLWKIINENAGGAIQWSKTGCTILINYEQLKNEHLNGAQNMFKTTNLASFIRQLNLYGFRKVSGHLRQLKGEDLSKFRRHDQTNHEFYNAFFLKGRPDLLSKITRKTISDKTQRPRKKTTQQEACQKTLQHNRISICRQALVNALEECASEEPEDESDSRTVQDNDNAEQEEIKFSEAWNNEVWLAANSSSPNTAEALLENINRGLLTSNNFTGVIHGINQTAEYAWTGNTPPTEFILKLQNPKDYEGSCESNIFGFGVENEIWNEDHSTAWQTVERQVLEHATDDPTIDEGIRENKENMFPRVIAQPIEISSLPFSAQFESNGLNWSF